MPAGRRALLAALLSMPLVLAGCTGLGASKLPNATTGGAAARRARSQVGRPYVWGGASPARGFDCSGLVYWAYGAGGIRLPKTAQAQSKVGEEIDPDDLREGDIVFFKLKLFGGWHEGIMIDSKRFVHAPRPGRRVSIESLSNPYWRKHLKVARRVAAN